MLNYVKGEFQDNEANKDRCVFHDQKAKSELDVTQVRNLKLEKYQIKLFKLGPGPFSVFSHRLNVKQIFPSAF